MKHTPEQLREYDKKWVGRMNPRDTFYCDICNKYYNGKSDTTLIFDEDKTQGGDDCVHGDDNEITEQIYNAHIQELKNSGFLEDDLEEN